MGGGVGEGVGFGFGFGLGVGRKELLFVGLVGVQVFKVLSLFCCLVLDGPVVGVELVGLVRVSIGRELSFDLPEYLGWVVRCSWLLVRGNVGICEY